MYFNSLLDLNIVINVWTRVSIECFKTWTFYSHRKNTKDVPAKRCPIYWKFHINLRFRAGLQYYRRSKVKYAAFLRWSWAGFGKGDLRLSSTRRTSTSCSGEGRSSHGWRSIDAQIMHCSSDKEPFLVRNALYHGPSWHDSDVKIKGTRENRNGRHQRYEISDPSNRDVHPYLRHERRRYRLICHV